MVENSILLIDECSHWRRCFFWRELINQKEDKEAKNMVLEKEWAQDQVEKYWKLEEGKEERD